MKWIITKLVLFLLLGAIVNIAVAWSSAVWFSQINPLRNNSIEGYSTDGKNYDFWETTRFETNGSLRVISSWNYRNPDIPIITIGESGELSDILPASILSAESLVPNWADFMRPYPVGQIRSGSFGFVVNARGWPLLSLWGGHKRIRIDRFNGGLRRLLSEAKEPVPIRAILLSHKDTRTRPGDITSRLLPLSPLWPGFAINTIIYASAIWLLTLGPFTLRRIMRNKQGCCTKCGYDLRGADHDVCPECGMQTSPTISS